MNIDDLKSQSELSKKAMNEILNQNRIFETTIQEAIKGAPEEHKGTIESFRILQIKAINLAKQGKIQEAQQLIKDFQHGGKNSK